jgi:uncharacterized membrane protein
MSDTPRDPDRPEPQPPPGSEPPTSGAEPQPPPGAEPPPPGAEPPPQPAQAPGEGQTAAGGLDPKIGGLLSYLLFGWIGGLIMYLTQTHPEVRFHAAQSILTFGGLTIVSFVVGLIPGLGVVLSPLIGLLSLVLWIILSIKGYNLEHFKLPVVGDMAEQWAAK